MQPSWTIGTLVTVLRGMRVWDGEEQKFQSVPDLWKLYFVNFLFCLLFSTPHCNLNKPPFQKKKILSRSNLYQSFSIFIGCVLNIFCTSSSLPFLFFLQDLFLHRLNNDIEMWHLRQAWLIACLSTLEKVLILWIMKMGPMTGKSKLDIQPEEAVRVDSCL